MAFETQDPNLILAAGAQHYEPLAVAQARQQALQQGAQDMQLRAQQIQAAQYGNQQTALDLRDAQSLSDWARQQRAAMAATPAAPVSPASPGTSVAAPPSMPVTPEGLVIRDPNYAGPVISTAPAIPTTPAIGAPLSAAQPAPLDWNKAADYLESIGAQPKTVFAIRQTVLQNQQKFADLAKTREEIETANAKLEQDEANAVSSWARGEQQRAAQNGGSYSLPSALAGLGMMADAHPTYAAHAQRLGQMMSADPDNLKAFIDKAAVYGDAPLITAQARATTAQTGAEKQANEAPTQQAAAQLAAAQAIAPRLLQATTPEEYGALRAQIQDPDVRARFPQTFDPDQVRMAAMTPEQQMQAIITQGAHDETARHNLTDESLRKVSNAISAGHLAQTQLVNGMKYGPGTQEYWVKQLAENPDSIKEMPPELRSSVGQAFKQTTGLPLPTPISGQTQQQETAARNALDNVAFVLKGLQNPEIRKNFGTIMGNLGDLEQKIGTAPNLSPEASKIAQEMRTRMNYLFFQEGKATLGGRIPEKLMSQLHSTSPRTTMDPNMLAGALAGVAENSRIIMDNADRQRFGGQMRPREMRGITPPTVTAPAPANKNPYR
jgi:hypothetical protein